MLSLNIVGVASLEEEAKSLEMGLHRGQATAKADRTCHLQVSKKSYTLILLDPCPE